MDDAAAAVRSGAQIKAQAREMFGRAAQAYVTSAPHALGADLERLVALAAPQPSDHALDVSTGGGHAALALAPHVGRIVVSDLTPRMLSTARTFLTSRGVTNAEYVVADAEALPFLDASFDLVTVRIAPHHYADVQAAVREMARVLVPGGRLVLIDNIAPEDASLDALLNEWEQRRDPSHVRAYRVSEWQHFVTAAGLQTTAQEIGRKRHQFTDWVERMQMSAAARAALEADILAAPPIAHEHFALEQHEGRLINWSADYVILRAVRAAS